MNPWTEAWVGKNMAKTVFPALQNKTTSETTPKNSRLFSMVCDELCIKEETNKWLTTEKQSVWVGSWTRSCYFELIINYANDSVDFCYRKWWENAFGVCSFKENNYSRICVPFDQARVNSRSVECQSATVFISWYTIYGLRLNYYRLSGDYTYKYKENTEHSNSQMGNNVK